MRWYFPSWYGDFRLEPSGKSCVLTLVDLTPHERTIIGEFLRRAHKKGWVEDEVIPEDNGPYRGRARNIDIHGPLGAVAKALIKASGTTERTLTAVSFKNGQLEVIEGAPTKQLIEAGDKAEETKAAVSVKRPTPSCPNCMPGAIAPATEVLLDFLTPAQHADWGSERAIVVTGEMTGHRYLLAHRHSRLAAQMGRICYDIDDGFIVHFHDWSVPPEEEVLAAKLILENREPWLRNEATCFNAPSGVVKFPNPFGDVNDGVWDASVMKGFGQALLAQVPKALERQVLAEVSITSRGTTYAEEGREAPPETPSLVSWSMSDLTISGEAFICSNTDVDEAQQLVRQIDENGHLVDVALR